MDSSPTLHDFVLNLLCDPIARSGFELDPEGALHDAGLGDITAADVQEVIPLVVDYAPVEGITSLVGAEALVTGEAGLDVTAAVSHLQAITAQVPLTALPTADVNTAVATAVTASATGLIGESVLAGAGVGAAAGVAGAVTLPATDSHGGYGDDHDLAASLDADVVASASATVDGVVVGTGEVVSHTAVSGVFGTLDGTVNTVTGLSATTGLLDPLDDVATLPAASSVVSSVVDTDVVGGVTDLDSTLGGVGGTVSGVSGIVVGEGGHAGSAGAGHDAVGGVTDLLF